MPSQTTTILLKCSMVDVPALNHVKLKSLYGVSTCVCMCVMLCMRSTDSPGGVTVRHDDVVPGRSREIRCRREKDRAKLRLSYIEIFVIESQKERSCVVNRHSL